MAYIGREPQVGNFQVCDAISVVNGQAAYTMQVNSVNVSPETANHMLVSLNGVLQAPTSSYTVSGSTITFASNLVTGDVINFIHILGSVLDLGTPSDSTVSLAKLTATGTKDATTFLRGDNTFAAAGSDSTPNFLVYQSSAQSLSANTETRLVLDTEVYDSDNAFTNTSGNYKFTIPSGEAGKYVLYFSVRRGNFAGNRFRVEMMRTRSGTELGILYGESNGGTNSYDTTSNFIILDCSVADTYHIMVQQDDGSSENLYEGLGSTFFGGYKLV